MSEFPVLPGETQEEFVGLPGELQGEPQGPVSAAAPPSPMRVESRRLSAQRLADKIIASARADAARKAAEDAAIEIARAQNAYDAWELARKAVYFASGGFVVGTVLGLILRGSSGGKARAKGAL